MSLRFSSYLSTLTDKIALKMHTFQTAGLSRNLARNNTVFKLLAYHRKEKECMYPGFFSF